MSFYRIDGGHRLTGELMVHGAKNSVLPILASTLLASGESVIHNCPKLSDVEATLAILRELGCRVTRQESTVTVDATTLTTSEISCELMQEMRSSVLFLGALISRIGEATVCAPGGCKLGPRPIDLHLSALSQMGVTIDERGESLACTRGTRTHSTTISLPFPSVGATENILLAACGCKGETILIGAAQEPEIVDLQNCLCSMGATISGAGTNKITIQGGRALSPTEYHVMGDRIVATTYLAAAAITGGTVAMRGISADHLGAVLSVFEQSGCRLSTRKSCITLATNGRLCNLPQIDTAPYPGFPTDAQPLLMSALASGEGETKFVENMFDSRYHHVEELCRMGASIELRHREAVISGRRWLRGAKVEGRDLRGTAALVVAALGARGISQVYGLDHLGRGYERLEYDLRSMGAEIRELKDTSHSVHTG